MIYSYQGNKKLPPQLIEAIKPNYKTGPWIAGGCARCLWQDEPINDVDIWIANNHQLLELTQRFNDVLGISVTFSTDNALTFDYYNNDQKWKLQIIIRNRFLSLEQVFSNFDFTVCQIATDGQGKFYMSEQVADDLHTRRLRATKFNKDGFLERWAKYTIYGFDMPKEELKEYLSSEELTWSLGDGRSLY